MQFNDVWQPFDQLYGQAARLTPFWKSENRGLKNIILAMTVMRDDSLFLPCLVCGFHLSTLAILFKVWL